MRIGFFGLGNMGGPMAATLARAGLDVTGYDVAGIVIEGVVAASSAPEAVLEKDVVITMLPNGKIVDALYDEILPLAGKGALFIDCSTIDIKSALSGHAKAEKHNIESLDAPVSGGIAAATAGSLTFMAGGAESAFLRALPLFEIMGKNGIHCGPAGSGQAAKICNNMILGISMIAVCEAFALADRLGLDRRIVFEVVSVSSGACWSMNQYCPAPDVGPKTPADHHYAPGFAAALMLKDLRLAQDAAESANAATPLGQAAFALYRRFVDNGGGDKDFSAILPWLSEQTRGEFS